MNQDRTIPDFTEEQNSVIRHWITKGVVQQVQRVITRIWVTVLALALTVAFEGLYISYVTGAKVEELNSDHAIMLRLQETTALNEINEASMNATLRDMKVQLNRIEKQTHSH